MPLPKPSNFPKTSAAVGATGGSAALLAILRELDPRWIPYIAIGAFFVVSLLATFLFLILRQGRRWRASDPENGYPRRYPSGYPETALDAHVAALAATRDREIVNFTAGTLTAVAGTALAVYFLITRAGLFGPIFIGVVTTVFAGFYFFSYRSLELHRRRLEAHQVYLLNMSNVISNLPLSADPDFAKARVQLLEKIAAATPVPETTPRSSAFRRRDLKTAIDMIRAAAGLKTGSSHDSD
jgi:hypothetical protein